MANYDIIGNIAILKSEGLSKEEILKQANVLLENPNIKTVVEKTERFKGRLRTIKVKHLLGEKNLVASYTESNCIFRLKIDSCYFSPRLANERLEVAKIIGKMKNPSVLVMFSGVAPFPIVIAKHSHPKKILSVELGKECGKYAVENIRLNKLIGVVEHIQGDVKKVIPKLHEKFDVIVMPRPNLKDIFLSEALRVSKRGTRIFYYGFCRENEKEKMIESIKKETKGKIKILDIKEAGDIAPYKHRYRIEMKVL